MILKDKNILIISPEPWTHLYVSKHHYAIQLSFENKVFFLNPPGKSQAVVCEETSFNNLFSVSYGKFVAGLRFLPGFLQRFFMSKVFNRVQKACSVEFDIIWSFDNSVFFDFRSFPEPILKICHIVDMNQDFEFEKLAGTADICLGVSSLIVEKLRKFNKNSHFMNHGWALDDVEGKKIEMPGRDRLKVGYAGNMDIPYIDLMNLKSIAEENGNIDLLIAGPWKNEQAKNDLLTVENAYFLGRLSKGELKFFYSRVDILVICYYQNKYPEQLTNSHKMMEYLGSGKMIVATWTDEYSKLDQKLILMARDKGEFQVKIKEAIKNIGKWNRDQLSNERIAVAKDNRYARQIERIEELLNNHG